MRPEIAKPSLRPHLLLDFRDNQRRQVGDFACSFQQSGQACPARKNGCDFCQIAGFFTRQDVVRAGFMDENSMIFSRKAVIGFRHLEILEKRQ